MNEEAELAEWRRKQADQDADIADIIAHYERMKDAPYNSIGGRALYRRIHKHFPAMAARLKAADAAADLVALWRAQKIAGVSRADRNAAIEEVRERLCQAVDAASRPISATGAVLYEDDRWQPEPVHDLASPSPTQA